MIATKKFVQGEIKKALDGYIHSTRFEHLVDRVKNLEFDVKPVRSSGFGLLSAGMLGGAAAYPRTMRDQVEDGIRNTQETLELITLLLEKLNLEVVHTVSKVELQPRKKAKK